ncbi:MAG: TIGR00296 family protein [Thermoplasmata archaeon]|nr:TIGR00296 family protein [Thermoplasmata archaeon]
MVTPEEGTAAVRLARTAIEEGLAHPELRDAAGPFRAAALPAVFAEPRGVFVTIRRHPSNALRGCIGFPSPVYPLRVAIPRAAWAAAVDDPRFPPVGAEELARVTLEVSILTVPVRIDRDPRSDLPREVVIGRDGLIADRAGASGLLLPQVAVEFHWSPSEFLSETCEKGGLPPDAWQRPGTTVRRFSAELFEEVEPGGRVQPVRLTGPGDGSPDA